MLTFIFIICMISVFGRICGLAVRGAWGITKVLFSLVFLPVVLIGLVLGNLIIFALPILIILGLGAFMVEA